MTNDKYHLIAWGKRYAIVPSDNKQPQLPPQPVAFIDNWQDAKKWIRILNQHEKR